MSDPDVTRKMCGVVFSPAAGKSLPGERNVLCFPRDHGNIRMGGEII